MSISYDDNEYRLCYVDKHVMFFTDNFEHQSGYDWNKRDYESEAWRPYELDEDEPKSNAGHIRYLGYLTPDDHSVLTPGERFSDSYGSDLSVNAINAGAVAWLSNRHKDTALVAGATMEDAVKWCRENDVKVGELT